MRQGPDVIDEQLDVFLVEAGRHVDHFLPGDITGLAPTSSAMKVHQLSTNVASIQRNQLGAVKHNLPFPVITVTLHADVGKEDTALLNIRLLRGLLGQDEWKLGNRLGRLLDLFLGQARRNGPHLLARGIVPVSPPLAFAEFSKLFRNIPPWQSRD